MWYTRITLNENTDLLHLYVLSVYLSLKYCDRFGKENKVTFSQNVRQNNKLELLYMQHQILTIKC